MYLSNQLFKKMKKQTGANGFATKYARELSHRLQAAVGMPPMELNALV